LHARNPDVAENVGDGIRSNRHHLYSVIKRKAYVAPEKWRFAILTAAAVATIIYVCLYPFRFSLRHGDIDAVGGLIGSWAKPPKPIDFVLNIGLFAPLGVFGALSASPRSRRRWRQIAVVTGGGTLLSIAIELTQYFDAARYTAASDVYANALGALLGACAVVLLFRR
jgi:hypothetical protein